LLLLGLLDDLDCLLTLLEQGLLQG
jgi:hypothetical protein